MGRYRGICRVGRGDDQRMKPFRFKNPFSCQNNNPIVRFITEQAFYQNMTMYDLGKRAGMSKDTIRHWRHKSTPRVDHAEAVLNVLRYTLKPVKIYGKRGKPEIPNDEDGWYGDEGWEDAETDKK